MKKALISPIETDIPITYISSWTDETPAKPIFSNIENSYRVAEVRNDTFEVSTPLFWIDCPDETIADQWYYDVNTGSVLPKENAPSPNPLLPS